MQISDVKIKVENAELDGMLCVPSSAKGLVLFAHGSGSGRKSPRNQRVAETLQSYGFATLLLDLLTHEEEKIDLETRRYRFDILLLAKRLEEATQWTQEQPSLAGLKTGYFGASTGAAAALIAAARLRDDIAAVVSRGGRPDLAGHYLSDVEAPTLLIVGSDDKEVIQLNEKARLALQGALVELHLVPAAGHLFEGPGQLEKVADLAGSWFETYLVKPEDNFIRTNPRKLMDDSLGLI